MDPSSRIGIARIKFELTTAIYVQAHLRRYRGRSIPYCQCASPASAFALGIVVAQAEPLAFTSFLPVLRGARTREYFTDIAPVGFRDHS